ncbi:glycosyltransferase [Pedobacter suwonensis]|uniref:glycosyltransferase n=1 Tax=Pedobacter suwonensis TaxID=332999 RepID=UPI003697AD6E
MRKKVLYLHASADLYGSDYVLLNLIKGLDKNIFDTLVLLPYEGSLCQEFQKNNIEYLVCDLPVVRRSMFSPTGIFKFIIQNFRFYVFISKLIKDQHISIIHTNTSAVWMGGFAAKLHGIKHIWQVMELVEKPRPVSYVIRKLVGIFSSKVFTISKAVRTFFLKVNKGKEDKFEVLYHGVDLKVYDPEHNHAKDIREKLGITDDTVVIGMAGRINGWKGHDVFVKSIPHVINRIDPAVKVKFLMLGDTFKGQEHFQVELEKLISSLPVSSSLMFMGFQSNFQDWLAAMDIFVLPSTLPEPNATVTIAAMAMKKPLIATAIGGTTETVIDNQTGFLIPPDDEKALADKIIDFINHTNKIREFGENGYKRAEQYFSMDNYGKVISEEYLKN